MNSTALAEATSLVDTYTAQESAANTIAMIEKLADKDHLTPDQRVNYLAALRETYAATAANRRLEPFTREVARIVGASL